MAPTKKYFRWLFLVAPMLVLLFSHAQAGKGMVAMKAPVVLSENAEIIDLPPGNSFQLFADAASEGVDFHVGNRLERKKRMRFLVRNCSFSHHIRKGFNKSYNFHYEPVVDLDHAPAPDEYWHTRPRYYIFLFRLCPF